jgi:hypothetical protein
MRTHKLKFQMMCGKADFPATLSVARWRSGNAAVCKTAMRRSDSGTRLKSEFTKHSAGQLCAVYQDLSMSAEHGHGGHESYTIVDFITTLFLMFTLIPAFTQPIEEAVQGVVNPDADNHGGHH